MQYSRVQLDDWLGTALRAIDRADAVVAWMARDDEAVFRVGVVDVEAHEDVIAVRPQLRLALLVQVVGVGRDEHVAHPPRRQCLSGAVEHRHLVALDLGVQHVEPFDPLLVHDLVDGEHRRGRRPVDHATGIGMQPFPGLAVESKVAPAAFQIERFRL